MTLKRHNVGTVWEHTKSATRKLATTVAGAALISGLMMALPKPARADSVEIMTGNKDIGVDLKASADLTKKVGLFIRIRPSIDYTSKIDSFGLADITMNLVGGLDAVGELQLFGGTAVPRGGVQYFGKIGDFSLYTIATMGLDSKPYLESLTTQKYAPKLCGAIGLLAQVENVSDFDGRGHIWSTQRMRLGVSMDGWGVGTATDLTETGNHPTSADETLKLNLGGFVSKTF